MELTNFLNNILNFDNVSNVLTSLNLRIKEDNDYPNLYMVLYDTNKSDFNNNIVNECRGIILEKNTNKVLCYTFNKGLQESNNFDFTNCTFEESIDGTQIRLYWYNNKWMYATTRCIDAFKSYYYSNKSFGELFDEANSELDLDRLDKSCCYSFVLCHPDNRIVVKYNQPYIVHVMTRNLETMEEINVDIGVRKPVKLEFDNMVSLQNYISSNIELEGVMVKFMDNSRMKLYCNNYNSIKLLRGNTNNIYYRYFELMKQNSVYKFLEYYPEYTNNFVTIKNNLNLLAKEIQKSYYFKFINRSCKLSDIKYELRPIVYELHQQYLVDNVITDINKVMSKLCELPVKRLAFIYNNFFK